jgi:pSer/pThr/pTyr-binding forkhead associated (FHA) protein
MHAVIERSPEGLVIIDLGSGGGTLVNGRKVNKVALVTGDTLQIGPFMMSVAVS